jgi:hypothetical protein
MEFDAFDGVKTSPPGALATRPLRAHVAAGWWRGTQVGAGFAHGTPRIGNSTPVLAGLAPTAVAHTPQLAFVLEIFSLRHRPNADFSFAFPQRIS